MNDLDSLPGVEMLSGKDAAYKLKEIVDSLQQDPKKRTPMISLELL